MKTYFLSIIIILFPLVLFSQTKWKQTSATAALTIKHSGQGVVGTFKDVSSFLVFSSDNLPNSSLRVIGKVSTLSTGDQERDVTLQGEDYFNAAAYPNMELTSTAINKNGERYTGTFNVTIRGVTKQIDIPFEFIESGNNSEFKCSFNISRRDFNIGKKGLANRSLSDKVQVVIDMKAESNL